MRRDYKYTKPGFAKALKEKVLVFDGANGTTLQNMQLKASHFGGEQYNGCFDYLAVSYPPAVEQIHQAYFEVGVDVVETNTFRANRIALAEYGLEDQIININRASAQIARNVADQFSTAEQPRFVAGSMGPSGKLPSADEPGLSDVSYDDLVVVFAEQAQGLIEGGVDLLLIETSQDILEVKAAIQGILQAFELTGERLPIQAQITLDTSGRMLLGTDVQSAMAMLEKLPIEVIGLNCSTGPEHMRQALAFLGEHTPLPVSALPNAGLPLNVNGEAVYPLEPIPFANAMAEFVEKNHIGIVGGCCGTTPQHLKLLVEKVHGLPSPTRPEKSSPSLTSSIQSVAMAQEPRPFLIGERLNATGSRQFKKMLLRGDIDAMVELAREQINGGAHALDVSVAITENPDELGQMSSLVKKLEMAVEAPLVIDTTEPEVMEAALKIAPGRCLLNSTHLEAGRSKMDEVFRIARQHNAAVLVLTIDEQGMAKSVERKLEIAHRIYQIAVDEFGFQAEDLVFDTLTFPLSTGDPEFANSAIATLEAIRKIKEELPGVFTSLGVSNVSFGLSKAARQVLNSMMLHHAVQYGLDMAIVHASKVKPFAEIPQEERQLMDDLIFNKRPDALERVIAYYENIEVLEEEAENPTEGMSPEEILYWSIVHRHKEGVDKAIDEVVGSHPQSSRHDRAVQLLNQTLLPAMKEVGDKFGAGELILPFVLQSAEVMKTAVAHLEQYLEKMEGVSKGKVVLATVYGDVHDIGKNLSKTILMNNGFEVYDLGKQVPAETIINKAVEVGATAIGLSALLVSTSKQMPLIVNELQRRKLTYPVLIGGAAINRRFGWRIYYTEDGSPYEPGVFYCTDAFEGLETMERLIDVEKKPLLLEELNSKAAREIDRDLTPKKEAPIASRQVKAARFIPQPPKWGVHVVKEMPLEIIFQHLNKRELYRLSWGAKNKQGADWELIEQDYEARLASMQKEALNKNWLKPQAVYGYWPVQAENEDLLVYSPESLASKNPEILHRFHFPRQKTGEGLSIADYFTQKADGLMDIVAFQVVSVGEEATRRFEKLQAEGAYTEAYYLHGLAVQTAEATAEYLHQHIRRELKLDAAQGKRYSWGYPAIPELDDHAKVFDLLPAEAELGMSLTAAFQLVPEQSTAAVIVHHPEAKYFSTGVSRVEQLLKDD